MTGSFENTGFLDAKTGELSPKGFTLSPIRQAPYLCPPGCESWWPVRTTIYDCALNRKTPLTYVDANGDRWRPDWHYETDMGSVPRLSQLIIPKDRFLGFYLHDSGYAHGGLWSLKLFRIGPPGLRNFDTRWIFVGLSRRDVDDMLRAMILADPCPGCRGTADAVWAAVRLAGWTAWNKGDLRKGHA